MIAIANEPTHIGILNRNDIGEVLNENLND